MNTAKITHWALRVLPAIIIGQTLFFKFTAHPESVALFTKLSMEPNGRIAIGILELIACFFLLFGGKRYRLGALLGCGLMLGAIYFHLTILGINALFRMAITTFVCCAIILRKSRSEIISLIKQQLS